MAVYTDVTLERASQICRRLPPLISQRIRALVYPYSRAVQDDLLRRGQAVTGGWFEGRTRDFHAYRMLVHGYFDWRNVAICDAVCEERAIVIEVGANIGTETVCFADIVGHQGRVVALEPDEENFRALLRMVQMNGFRHVEVVRCAAGERDGEVRFELTPDRCMSGIGFVGGENQSGGVTVEVRRLDWWVENGLNRVDAVFIDVEGYEPAVLRGAENVLRTFRPVVVLEASPKLLARNGWGLGDLGRELSKAEYRFLAIGRFGLKASDLQRRRAENWLCLPKEKMELAETIQRTLHRAGWMPMIRGLNPLVRG